jgi:aspartyl aminopeptidase
LLQHTWVDRDLGVAGRLAVHDDGDDGDDGDGGIRLVNVRLDEPLLRIPSLAIHLDRDVNRGLELNPQRHLVPVLGPEGSERLLDVLAGQAGVRRESIVGHDLVAADTQPATLGGMDGAYLFAPRLDNLYSCHAGMHALIDAEPRAATQAFVANDHEEVASAEGAAGGFLDDVLRRITVVTGGTDPQDHLRAIAHSLLVSSDTAHAVHPNYADRHEPEHRPRLGGGPVLKVNADQRYATDAGTGGWFAARCAEVGVPLQVFVTRGDMPCGSTIGPLTATRTGISTVDVGNPILSMHSLREQASAADVRPMVAALGAHLSSSSRVVNR